ncbi:ABC transporter permease [Microbacterium sp. SORGH_AS_0888]|uniref:ABC transporter permease n=1 Tax=Microbacterium sp. SORGH_AS_0888 TaxID=3041791 RepID=UPI002789AC65|nr:ABC transporter permease [Microbacterium sp. SORGH_AS_0888]MDQ1128603.1 sulfonate transport system permease protein [Microbacterium sp. SORGH_AS_0888]
MSTTGIRPTEAPTAAPSILARRGVRIALGAVLPVVLIIVWFAVTIPGAAVVAPYQFPSPQGVWQAAVDLAERGELGIFVAISVQRVLIGFVIAAVLGVALGGLVGLSRFWDATLSPSLEIIRAVPSLAWVPLLIVWFQIGEQSKIILIVIGAFFPIFTMVSISLHHVDPKLIELGRAYGFTGIRLFFTVQLPAVLPSVFGGLRLALVQAWLFLIAAELLGASMGLGFLLTRGQSNGRVDQIVLAIILLAVLGKLSDSLLALAQRWAVRRWG